MHWGGKGQSHRRCRWRCHRFVVEEEERKVARREELEEVRVQLLVAVVAVQVVMQAELGLSFFASLIHLDWRHVLRRRLW